jgi:SRSO17 transposase
MKASMPKKGERSAGLARQWNSRPGKVDNGQVGVFAPLCRAEMARLVDARLSLPQGWTQDAARRERAGIPKPAREYRRKHVLALAMVTTA